jgi:hypothetical protein
VLQEPAQSHHLSPQRAYPRIRVLVDRDACDLAVVRQHENPVGGLPDIGLDPDVKLDRDRERHLRVVPVIAACAAVCDRHPSTARQLMRATTWMRRRMRI